MELSQFKRSFNQIIFTAKQQLRDQDLLYTAYYRTIPELYVKYPFLVWVSKINIDTIRDAETCCELFSRVKQYLWDRKSDWCEEYAKDHSDKYLTTTVAYGYKPNLSRVIDACLSFYKEIAPTIIAEYNQYLDWDLQTSLDLTTAPFQLQPIPIKSDHNYAALLLRNPDHIKAFFENFSLLEPQEHDELTTYIEKSKSFFSNANPECVAIAMVLTNLYNNLCPQLTVRDAGKNHLFAEYVGSIEESVSQLGDNSKNIYPVFSTKTGRDYYALCGQALYTVFSTETGRDYYALCRQAVKNNELPAPLKFIQFFYGFYQLYRFLHHNCMIHTESNVFVLCKRIKSRVKAIILKNEVLYLEIIKKIYDIETLLIQANNFREISAAASIPENFFSAFKICPTTRVLDSKKVIKLSTDEYMATSKSAYYLGNYTLFYDEYYSFYCRPEQAAVFIFCQPNLDIYHEKYRDIIKTRISVAPDAIISQQVFDQLYSILIEFTYLKKLIQEFKISNIYLLKDAINQEKNTSDLQRANRLTITKRIYEGGQFTIYLHRNFNTADMIDFTHRIEQILTAAKILSGAIPQSDKAIGRYMSITIDHDSSSSYISALNRNPQSFMQHQPFVDICQGMELSQAGL